MSAVDIVLSCASCGLRYAGPVGQAVSGAIDLARYAQKSGWFGAGHGRYVDPACAKRLGLDAGFAAAISSALTEERAHAARAALTVDHSGMRLGRLPPEHDSRTLRLAKYLGPELLSDPPARRDWMAAMTDVGTMGNDAIGDCTIATIGHFVQAWTAANGSQVVIPDAEIIAAYSAITGYDPADPSSDQGAFMLDVLNYWRTAGIGGHKIHAFVGVDLSNRRHVELAIDMFGGVCGGFELPVSAQTQEVWAVPDGGPVGAGAPGTWGGHELPLLNYGPLGLGCITWGAPKIATWSWVEAYGQDGFAVLSEDWATGGRRAPSGFDLEQLRADLAQIAG